jgi:hypothetical protein
MPQVAIELTNVNPLFGFTHSPLYYLAKLYYLTNKAKPGGLCRKNNNELSTTYKNIAQQFGSNDNKAKQLLNWFENQYLIQSQTKDYNAGILLHTRNIWNDFENEESRPRAHLPFIILPDEIYTEMPPKYGEAVLKICIQARMGIYRCTAKNNNLDLTEKEARGLFKTIGRRFFEETFMVTKKEGRNGYTEIKVALTAKEKEKLKSEHLAIRRQKAEQVGEIYAGASINQRLLLIKEKSDKDKIKNINKINSLKNSLESINPITPCISTKGRVKGEFSEKRASLGRVYSPEISSTYTPISEPKIEKNENNININNISIKKPFMDSPREEKEEKMENSPDVDSRYDLRKWKGIALKYKKQQVEELDVTHINLEGKLIQGRFSSVEEAQENRTEAFPFEKIKTMIPGEKTEKISGFNLDLQPQAESQPLPFSPSDAELAQHFALIRQNPSAWGISNFKKENLEKEESKNEDIQIVPALEVSLKTEPVTICHDLPVPPREFADDINVVTSINHQESNELIHVDDINVTDILPPDIPVHDTPHVPKWNIPPNAPYPPPEPPNEQKIDKGTFLVITHAVDPRIKHTAYPLWSP